MHEKKMWVGLVLQTENGRGLCEMGVACARPGGCGL